MPCWLQVLQGLLTPVIGLIALYIAWQQHRTETLKLKIDTYERKVKVYQETHKYISIVFRDCKPKLPELFAFSAATAEADFLFPPIIRTYLDEIFTRAYSLYTANMEYRNCDQEQPPGYDHMKVCKTLKENTDWFMEQVKAAKEVFKPSLDLSKTSVFGV
jgi:hypothetical protein